jgi:hypothetical protein
LLCTRDEFLMGWQSEACSGPQLRQAKGPWPGKRPLSARDALVALRRTSEQRRKKPAPVNPALSAGSFLTCSSVRPFPLIPLGLFNRNLSKPNALDGRPDDGQTTHLGGEHVDLVGALTDKAPQTLDGIGGPDVAMHRLRKVVKSQRLVFLLS